AFVINLLLVIYLVWTKRLFGVRGGKAAYEARLRSESVIEVEQAALAAASPGQPGHAKPTQHHGPPGASGNSHSTCRKYGPPPGQHNPGQLTTPPPRPSADGSAAGRSTR
ncbi:MAG TPA: hypothetical protein VGI96_21020, partial [Streptosporangiaceae bacterium]